MTQDGPKITPGFTHFFRNFCCLKKQTFSLLECMHEGHEDISAYLHFSFFLCISLHFEAFLYILHIIFQDNLKERTTVKCFPENVTKISLPALTHSRLQAGCQCHFENAKGVKIVGPGFPLRVLIVANVECRL